MCDVLPMDRAPDVIHQHVSDASRAPRSAKQVLGQSRGRNLRDVFMLRDGGHLAFVEAAQGDAIFKCDVHQQLRLPDLA